MKRLMALVPASVFLLVAWFGIIYAGTTGAAPRRRPAALAKASVAARALAANWKGENGGVALAGGGDAAALKKPPSGPPVILSATARAVEGPLQSIEDLGAGQNPRWRWTWRVHFVGLGGDYGADEAADVPVLTNSGTALPGTVTRCTVYKDYVDALPGTHNTIGTLGCDILTYAITTPL